MTFEAMGSTDTTSPDDSEAATESLGCIESKRYPHLIVIWSAEEPYRIGESAVVPEHGLYGRGGVRQDDPAPRLVFVRKRHGAPEPQPPFGASKLSRRHLLLRTTRDGTEIDVECVGRRPLLHNGMPQVRTSARAGDVLTIRGTSSLLVELEQRGSPAIRHWPCNLSFEFGSADPFGMIGETSTIWRLRERLAEAARSSGHVLLLGPSGAGKELAARAIHELSSRSRRPLVSRNAATLPAGIVDAELFGCAKNYPNAGSAERAGLVGAADGSTLFLDEVAELPEHQQAHLLRFLDQGEYQRLGESIVRRSTARVVAATNRSPSSLKHDFLARFVTRLELPSLNERRADIPLLMSSLLGADARARPRTFEPFLHGDRGVPAVTSRLVELLVRHRYTGNVRELDYLLRVAVSSSEGHRIDATPELMQRLRVSVASAAAPPDDRERLLLLLAKHRGNASEIARDLGLSSRFALYRLLKKHQIRLGGGR